MLALLSTGKVDLAVIEQVASRPGQGVSSTFKFGQSYGALRTTVTACWIPTHPIAVTRWKRHFHLGSDKERPGRWLRLWPSTALFSRRKDHNRSEAALLASYGAEVLWRHAA